MNKSWEGTHWKQQEELIMKGQELDPDSDLCLYYDGMFVALQRLTTALQRDDEAESRPKEYTPRDFR